MVGLKNGHIRKNLTQKVVNPRDIAGERKKKKKKKKKKPFHVFTLISFSHKRLASLKKKKKKKKHNQKHTSTTVATTIRHDSKRHISVWGKVLLDVGK